MVQGCKHHLLTSSGPAGNKVGRFGKQGGMFTPAVAEMYILKAGLW